MELTQAEVIERLKSRVAERVSQQAVAVEAGVSPQHLNDVLHGKRDIGPAMLALLGVQRDVRFVAAEALS
ncbi:MULTISPECIES: helix-turn-helix domain-containing protein [Methylorubrum]|uniref:Transcriptional regulator with XRE-family HTH domain n=1 Tax=Methylorubrum thiocyanatum TaxID=47958 RepID=A0AA40S5V3_9HYPH|nr:helix-turn-helix transcriptional regulator [Methylorubrum thiocyanatum]MBA8915078.1 transcriptional regulator with XRE-family HTH domain [Methylorubrum thiocyanatum]